MSALPLIDDGPDLDPSDCRDCGRDTCEGDCCIFAEPIVVPPFSPAVIARRALAADFEQYEQDVVDIFGPREG